MILPTKYVRPSHSLLAAGARVLEELESPVTVSGLWERAQSDIAIETFARFVLTLDLLYMTGAIETRRGLIVRAR